MKLLVAVLVILLGPGCSVGKGPPQVLSNTIEPAARGTGAIVVMLGSGTPIPDSDRSGPAVAVVTGGRAYLVDFGAGVVRQAQTVYEQGIFELAPPLLSRAFLTHLHADHTLGYTDLIMTPAIVGRAEPLLVHGPPGLRQLTDHLMAAYEPDIAIRTVGESEAVKLGYSVQVREIGPGRIYADTAVSVTAFAVSHGRVTDSFGYRFDTAERSIVISGDTAPCDAVVEACDGCDVLIHEVYCQTAFDLGTSEWQEYHATHHTSTLQVAQLAKRARPKLLVLYHVLTFGLDDQQLLDEMTANYDGEFVLATDLAIY